MGPKINGLSISDLVSTAVEKRLAEELGVYKASLDNALSRIKDLEEEIANFREMSNNNFPITKSPSKNTICKHWLRNQCTWKQKCRFSHCQSSTSTSPTSSASSLSGSIAKDTEVVVKTAKVEKSVQVSFPMVSSPSLVSTSVAQKSSSVLTRPSFVSGVLQPELVGAALTHDVAEGVVDCLLDAVVEIANKTDFAAKVAKDAEWVENMLLNIAKLEERYNAKSKPGGDDGTIYSAQVAIPKVDFSKVKPHLHRNLPKPSLCPVYGCAEDPKVYTDCGLSEYHRQQKQHKCDTGGCKSKFDNPDYPPFGSLPGFCTNLGVVPVPQDPIGGFVYKGGTDADTTWQLYADAVYI